MSASDRKRVAVLASGRGTNFRALAQAAANPAFPVQIVRLVTNRPGAGALAIAAEHGIAPDLIDHRQYASREAHEAAVATILEREGCDLICLAGYMRILTAGFVRRFAGRMLNIHPSLLPLFPGTHTHERALEAGVKLHGATVHFVTEVLDGGPIVAQAAIAVRQGDTADMLAERLLPVENRLYPHALALVASGAAQLVGERVAFASASAMPNEATLFSPPLAAER